MKLTFNKILELEEIQPDKVQLVRHQDGRSDPVNSPYSLWVEKRDSFELYQRIQSRDVFKTAEGSLIASFVVSPDSETIFVGIYGVFALGKVAQGTKDPVSGNDVSGLHLYDLQFDPRLSDYIGKIVVDWGGGYRSWVQRAHKQDKQVFEIRRKFEHMQFPGFLDFEMPLSTIAGLPYAWRQMLGNAKGVYLLTCPKTKEQYVGSATGVGGFQERWTHHAKTGGDAVRFKSRDPSDYTVTILEVAGTGVSDKEILTLEYRWMRKLRSVEMGLNGNPGGTPKAAVGTHERDKSQFGQGLIGDDNQANVFAGTEHPRTATVGQGLSIADRIKGCLLGGAVGDALGGPIEFLSLNEIRERFGPDGLRNYAPAYNRLGAITDDTQMTLFTAEGLIRAWMRSEERGLCSPPGVIHHAYLRWLLTQGERPTKADLRIGTDGWLFAIPALHQRRAPGNTCLSALRDAEAFGSPTVARNDSKGCGGVMRVAPVGLFALKLGNDDRVFTMAAELARLTHGHSSGFLAAGYLAVVIASLMRGDTIDEALDAASAQLETREGGSEVARAVVVARSLAARGRPSPEDLEGLGGGWVAEEALAIAICCALSASDFEDGIVLAANHSGDSDSTAAIAGNVLGAHFGTAAIPERLLQDLEMRNEIERLSDDLHATLAGFLTPDNGWEFYPGW